MPPDLPPEIWTNVLTFLPPKSLHLVQHVNHVTYHICRAILFRDLVLVARFTKDNVEEQIQVLRKRLNLAKLHPTLIKSIRFMPTLVIPDFVTSIPGQMPTQTQTQGKPFQFFRRLSRKTGEEPIRDPITMDLADINNGLASLIPSLTSLEELEMEDSWSGGWSSTADLALKATASQLTVLGLHFWSPAGFPDSFPFNEDPVTIPLPALHTFRLSLIADPNGDFESRVQRILSASPFLREIQYLVRSNGNGSGNGSSHGLNTPRYPCLKVFKWATPLSCASSHPLPLSFANHASQLDVIHLDSPPSLDIFSSLNMTQLIELRVDFRGRTNAAHFFAVIIAAEQLVVLEAIVFARYEAARDPAILLPGAGLSQLKQLYLGIMLPLFSIQSLIALAAISPGLHKLVLLAERPYGMSREREHLLDIGEELLRQFLLSTSTNSFSDWRLADFGILCRTWSGGSVVKISDLEGILNSISRIIPSIVLFYGTGSLRLWEGIEDDIDKKWGGELWNDLEKKS